MVGTNQNQEIKIVKTNCSLDEEKLMEELLACAQKQLQAIALRNELASLAPAEALIALLGEFELFSTSTSECFIRVKYVIVGNCGLSTKRKVSFRAICKRSMPR